MTAPRELRFRPDAKGWVVRRRTLVSGRHLTSWWYGPDHGFGTTSGPLDYGVAVFRTKREGFDAIAGVYGVPLPSGSKVERIADAVKFSIAELEENRVQVLAGDRDDKASIAEAIDSALAYLRGEQAARR